MFPVSFSGKICPVSPVCKGGCVAGRVSYTPSLLYGFGIISEKNAAYNTYRTAKAEYEQLATAKRNAEQILHGTPSRQKKHEQER